MFAPVMLVMQSLYLVFGKGDLDVLLGMEIALRITTVSLPTCYCTMFIENLEN